VKMFCEEVQRR